MSSLRGLLLLSFLVPLSGCLGANPFCMQPCPGKDEIRDSFCGCMKRPKGASNPTPSSPSQVYMVARYSCKDNSHPDQDAGTCDIIQYADSCQSAKNGILQDVQSRGDPCVHCTKGVTDNTKHWDGNSPSWIQGGSCTNESSLHDEPWTLKANRSLLSRNQPYGDRGIAFVDEEVSENLDSENHTNHSGPTLVLASLSTSHPAQSCLDLCPKDETLNGNCSVNVLKDATQSGSIDKLRTALLAGTSIITEQELTSDFHTSDPCTRGATTISNTTLTNDGVHACTVSTDLTNLDLTLQLDVPKHLEAQWVSRSPAIKLTFSDPRNAPSLSFLKPHGQGRDPINDNFGGVVQSVEADDGRLFLRVPHGCVGVIYKGASR